MAVMVKTRYCGGVCGETDTGASCDDDAWGVGGREGGGGSGGHGQEELP
jgi:hypothetical protein